MKRLLTTVLLLVVATGLAGWLMPSARARIAAWVPAPLAALLPAHPEGLAGGGAAKRNGPPAAPVTAATVALREMPIVLTTPGTVEPRATVTVKPRVDGQISEVLFKEGDLVKEGQILFRLDDRLAKAQIAQAEANIKRDQATLADAEGTYNRRQVLVQKKIVSEQAMDTARATMEALKASIAAGRAALEAQKTQLDYLVIPAPITGRTGSTTFKPGANIRSADTTPLVVINQTQPILVTFAVPQKEIGLLRRALDAKSKAEATIVGPTRVSREGAIEFIDNQVDRQTGTLTAKALFPNGDEALWPGQSVELALQVETQRDTLAVPVSAVLPAQQGMITWVIGPDMKVQPRPVTLLRVVGQTAYLADGVKPGERVVTDGQARIAPGFTVQVREPAPAPTSGAKKERTVEERKS